MMVVSLLVAGCGWKPASSTAQKSDICKDSDGPRQNTVRRAIEGLPSTEPASAWAEIARGHTGNCRLYWVQVIPNVATEATGQQLLFFDHNIPLGTPTAHPKPYTAVLSATDDTVKVQYQWLIGNDPPCCPTGIGTVSYRIGSDGALQPVGPIPNQ
ncbi:MAG: LppP/LprE family lipoprotein [Mycobacteriaceae bacterium]|nr:LppP/LprE family lipoprotein [Mycobacteriaceae bacterium]